MATHESADLQAALNGDLGGIPFRTELSLKPVIDFWTRMAGKDSAKGAVARVITDRKSTRLNSSHSQISYAVFCLKKKKKQQITHVAYTVSVNQPNTSATRACPTPA